MDRLKRLGNMLVDAGYLQESQLQEAIRERKKTETPLVKILLRNQHVTEEQVAVTLSDQLGIPVFQFEDYSLSEALRVFLPADLVKQCKIIPIEDGVFSFLCAMVDPHDGKTVERVEQEIGKPVDVVICTETQFSQIYEIIYGDSFAEQLTDILDEAEDSFEPEPEEKEETEQSLEHMAAETPVVRTVNWILAKGVQEGASDIHISPERNAVSLRMRIDGKLKEVKAPPKSMLLSLISRIKIMSKMDISLSNVPQDGRFSLKLKKKEINFRASCLPTVNGENIVLRILNMDAQHLDLDQLGFEGAQCEKIKEMMKKPSRRYGAITAVTFQAPVRISLSISILLSAKHLFFCTFFSATPYTTETNQGPSSDKIIDNKMMKNALGCCRASGKLAKA